MSFEIGQDIPLVWEYKNADGTYFDPIEVRLYWQPPSATTPPTTTEYVYGRDEQIVKVATGKYSAIVRAAIDGVATYKTVGLGTATEPEYSKPGPDKQFRIVPTRFTVEPPASALMHWGSPVSAPANESDVLALSGSDLRSNFKRTIGFSFTSRYMAVSYPAAWGTAHYRFVDGQQPIAVNSTLFSVGGVQYRNDASFYVLTLNESVEVF